MSVQLAVDDARELVTWVKQERANEGFSYDDERHAIANIIADLLHYAKSLGIDPRDISDKAFRYYDADNEEED